MKKLLLVMLMFGTSFVFAGTTTNMSTKWICTTNASSSDQATDKAADDKMAKSESSAAHSFAFAEKNCRDCTKITCEAK